MKNDVKEKSWSACQFQKAMSNNSPEKSFKKANAETEKLSLASWQATEIAEDN